MAQRDKRSVSLPADLAAAVDEAARARGTTFSAWLANAADHRLRIEAGWSSLQEWEAEHGRLTDEERRESRARARGLLGRPSIDKRPAHQTSPSSNAPPVATTG